jgi:hypothetical protein
MNFQMKFPKVILSCAVFCCLTAPAFSAHAEDITVGGKTLKMLGSGLREFLFIDIYTLSAFSESGDCTPGKIVYSSEVKSMHLKMMRDIPAERLKENLKGTFENNMPEKGDIEGLKKKIDDFLGRFKNDFKTGANVEINYIPGQGTTVKENGKSIGAVVQGRDFAELVWRSYFGANSAAPGLKSDILEQCKNNQK